MNNCKRQILVWICCGVYLFATAQDQSSSTKDSLSVNTLNTLLNTISQTVNDTSLITIADISIHGNKKTRPYIIEREIPFHQGEYIPRNELDKKLVLAQQQVMNTALFTQVFVYVESQ